MTATPHDREYCKLSIVAQASAQMKLALPKEDLQPYKEHFHPQGTGSEVVERKGKQRPPGSPFVGLHVNPLKDPVRLSEGFVPEIRLNAQIAADN